MESFHTNDLNHLSTCKSPIGMQGAMIKSYFAKLKNLNPEDIVTVTIAPCISKKTEIRRDKLQDNDYMLTTSELVLLFREQNIDFQNIKPQKFDSLLGSGSGAGLIFGTSGGVMEAVLRTAYYFLNGKKAPDIFLEFTSLRGDATLQEKYKELGKYHFVEVMACPSGCVGGGGQPLIPKQQQENYVEARRKSLYEKDKDALKKSSYENEEIQKVYKEFLEYPFSEKSEKYLHTHKTQSNHLKSERVK